LKERIIQLWKKFTKWSNTWTGTLIIVMVFISFIAQSFRIPSGSMKDTLLVGDMLFGKKFAYGIPTPHIPFLEIPLIPGTDGHLIDGDKPQRGDIVIFRYPHNPKQHFVKRCVGTPGDELFYKDKELYIHFNEKKGFIEREYSDYEIIELYGKKWVKNPYRKTHLGIHNDDNIKQIAGMPEQLFNMPVIKVPENEFFMMGDNRDHSNDSRFWGSVPYGLIEGTPWIIWMSISENWNIRFDRILRTPKMLEEKSHIEKAIKERLKEKPHKKIT
jgi:signal peptidase I